MLTQKLLSVKQGSMLAQIAGVSLAEVAAELSPLLMYQANLHTEERLCEQVTPMLLNLDFCCQRSD